ncbi:hypothetical protein ABT324_02735 [Saccharopolyspora sp. NPDC000359]|uniref:hypothetical protein n=1 Tax=Saccharopolyspora sp. NPDC000359 TaxID=3154251 RepID=UPI0033251FB2
MSIEPDTVRITDEELSGVLRLQHGGTFKEYPFRASHSLGEGPMSWCSEWPYEEFSIEDKDGQVVSAGVVAHLQSIASEWPREASDHDIEYVGQAFGRSKERTAWDRLKHHETVQKILAETTPDKQVWLTLAAITDLKLGIDINPGPSRASDKEDNAHNSLVINTFHQGEFKDRHAVALAEAGLIRMFQPNYNERLKNKFPSSSLVSLESVRPLDLHGVLVELQGWDVGMRYGTKAKAHDQLHFGGFVIHTDDNRSAPVFLEPRNDLKIFREY